MFYYLFIYYVSINLKIKIKSKSKLCHPKPPPLKTWERSQVNCIVIKRLLLITKNDDDHTVINKFDKVFFLFDLKWFWF